MQLYLTRRNLNGIAGIDLAGITPLVEKTVALGDGADYDDKSKSIDLPLTKEGAYLTMIRGDNLYASGIVLVTPLEMEVLEEPGAGRPRLPDASASPSATPAPRNSAQGAGQGDRQRRPPVHLGRDGPSGRVRRGGSGLVTAVARKGTASMPSTGGPITSGTAAEPFRGSGLGGGAGRQPPSPASRPNSPSTPTSRCRTRRIPQANRAAAAAIRSAGRQEKGSGGRRFR